MLKSFSDKAIAAKARAMYGSRLTPSDYDQLMKRTTVPEAAAYLRDHTHYREVLNKADLTSIHRGQLEEMLRRERTARYARLIHYDFTRGTSFFQYLFLWDEVTQIIHLLRHISAGSTGTCHIRSGSQAACSYDRDALLRARSYDAALEALQGTPYHRLLQRHLSQQSSPNMAALERELLCYYYQKIFDSISKQFGKGTAKELQKIFLSQIQMENIAIAYRLRRFFNSSPAFIRENLLPFGAFDQGLIAQIMAAAPQDLEAVLRASPLGAVCRGNEMEPVETLILRLRAQTSRRLLRYSTSAPVVLAAYVTQMDVELSNIINIVEGIRYGLAPQEIAGMTVL